MNRRAGTVFVVAALFGAQGPLCALACLAPSRAAMPPLAVEEPIRGDAPCHGEGHTSPERPASGPPVCSCDGPGFVPAKEDGLRLLGLSAAAPLAAPAAELAGDAPRRTELLQGRDRDPPPPDIPLLNSSLLL